MSLCVLCLTDKNSKPSTKTDGTVCEDSCVCKGTRSEGHFSLGVVVDGGLCLSKGRMQTVNQKRGRTYLTVACTKAALFISLVVFLVAEFERRGISAPDALVRAHCHIGTTNDHSRCELAECYVTVCDLCQRKHSKSLEPDRKRKRVIINTPPNDTAGTALEGSDNETHGHRDDHQDGRAKV